MKPWEKVQTLNKESNSSTNGSFTLIFFKDIVHFARMKKKKSTSSRRISLPLQQTTDDKDKSLGVRLFETWDHPHQPSNDPTSLG